MELSKRLVKEYRSLNQKKFRQNYNKFLVEGDKIVDFQSGNYTQREILEMFSDEPKE